MAVFFDDFTGATDDEKLTHMLSYVAAQTRKPSMILAEGDYTFTQTRDLFNGFSMVGDGPNGNEFRYNQRVKLNIPGSGWLRLPSTVKGIYIGQLSFEGNSETSFFVDQVDGSQPVLWASLMENLGFSGFKHIIHGVHTAVTLTGYWDVNNGYDTQFKLKGSDNNYWTDGMLLDSPNMTSGDKQHIYFVDISKTRVGPVFVTGKSNVTPMRIDNGVNLVVNGARLESQAGVPTWGSQLLIKGGKGVTIRDAQFFNGMNNPAAMSNIDDHQGIITIRGGTRILIDAPHFSNGWGRQSCQTPAGTAHIVVDGGTQIRLRDLQAEDSWIKVLRNPNVPAEEIVTDSDITVYDWPPS